MAFLPLNKRVRPGFGCRQIPLGNVVHDKSNSFGARSFWSFFPGTHGIVQSAAGGHEGQIYKSNGQPLIASLRTDAGSAVNYATAPYSGDSLGYRGMVANFFDQGTSGGFEFNFGSGQQGRLEWPNKQSITMWGLFKPIGDGSGGQLEDPRILSRDDGTGTANHYYMFGGVRSGGNVQSRMRFKIGGTTQTVVVTSQDWQNDALNFIAATYDGSNLTLHHIREDGGYGTASTSASGDISDSTSGAVGLALGGNFVNDNAFEGEVLAVGALDYAENDQLKLLNFRNDIGQILKPAIASLYFVPVSSSTGLVVQDLAVATSLTSPTLTQHNVLAVDNLSVATSLTEPSLSQHNVLAVDDMAAATSLTEPSLVQNFALLADDMAVATSLTEPNLTQHQILSVNDLAVAFSLTGPGLTQHNIIAVDDLNVGTTLSNVTLSVAGVLAVQDLSVGTTITSPALTQHNVLVVDNMAVSSSLSEPALTQHNALAVDNLAVGTVITQSTLNTAISLLVDNLAVGTVLSVPLLDQHNVLIVDDIDVQTLLSNVSLSGAAIGCLSGKVVIAQLLDGKISIQPVLGGNITIH